MFHSVPVIVASQRYLGEGPGSKLVWVLKCEPLDITLFDTKLERGLMKLSLEWETFKEKVKNVSEDKKVLA
jgi:hypothetical protein